MNAEVLSFARVCHFLVDSFEASSISHRTVAPRYNTVVGMQVFGPPYKRGGLVLWYFVIPYGNAMLHHWILNFR